MKRHDPIPRYGVLIQSVSTDELSRAAESLQMLGFAVVDAGYTAAQVADLQNRFENLRTRVFADYGIEALRAIDEHNERLKPLDSFILPGGTGLSAALHVARTVVRRAERCTVALAAAEKTRTNAETVLYLNRLSDLLFVLGRVANDDGRKDVKWVPGASRDS